MITDKQKIEILETGTETCIKAIDFIDAFNKWNKFICKFDNKELKELTNNNYVFKSLNEEFKRVAKEISKLKKK